MKGLVHGGEEGWWAGSWREGGMEGPVHGGEGLKGEGQVRRWG